MADSYRGPNAVLIEVRLVSRVSPPEQAQQARANIERLSQA